MFENGSPYREALGERFGDLHPRLREYFDAMPEGAVGTGSGTFDVVGTKKWWLWPILRVLQHRGVVPSGHHTDVAFRVTNRETHARRTGERTLLINGVAWTMRDSVRRIASGRIVDTIGKPATVAASFDVLTVDGALHLTSVSVGVRCGRLRIRLPRCIAPRVHLIERLDEGRKQQHVSLRMHMPFIGQIYEYAGFFDYTVATQGEAA